MNAFPPSSRAFAVVLPRNAFGPRLVARPGDVWRAMQDAVTDQSSSVGWTPERYADEGLIFVVREMKVVHRREVRFGEALVGRTWPSRERKGTLFTREVRLLSGEAVVAHGSQEWALLSRSLEPTRAGPALMEAFTVEAGFPSTRLPDFVERRGASTHRFGFTSWHLAMDAHAHVNHPAYLDFCDEGLSRAMARAGLDPQALCPVAEALHFRSAVGAEEAVEVETTLAGEAEDVAVFKHRVRVGERVCATATTFRRLVGGAPGWAARLA